MKKKLKLNKLTQKELSATAGGVGNCCSYQDGCFCICYGIIGRPYGDRSGIFAGGLMQFTDTPGALSI